MRSGLLSDVSDPQAAYRPFDVAASGYVPAEGGAVFVVEELGHALARGARVYGEITGWAATHDAAPTDPATGPDPAHYARALRLALAAVPRRYREGPLQQAAKERAARLTAA